MKCTPGIHDRFGSRAEVESQLQVLESLRFLRKYLPGFEDCYVVSNPFQVGIRETRHVQGDYVLTGDDVTSGRDFDDHGKLKPAASGKADAIALDEQAANALSEALRDPAVSVTVSSVESKPYTRRPAAPFSTSTLQQEAARKLRFSARQTMSVAQGLYENGYITYMRTDSLNLSQQAIGAARSQASALYGAETVPEKASFRNAFRRRRCIFIADAFYEWRRPPGGRRKGAPPSQPYLCRRVDGAPMALAGLWETWWKGGEPLRSLTILTCAPSAEVAPIHDRMPCVLPAQAWPAWLDPRTPVDVASGLLGPDAGGLVTREVGTGVNDARHTDGGWLPADLPGTISPP